MDEVQQEAPKTFQERARERLQVERGDMPRDDGTLSEQPEAIAEEAAPIRDEYEEAGQVDAEPVEGLESEQPEGEDGVDTLDEGEAEPQEGSVEYWRAKAEKAVEESEDFRKDTQADYTRKTQAIAEARHKLEDDLGEVTQTAEYYAQKAEQQLAQFAGVNWQQLQSNPEQYQNMQQQWTAANQQVQQTRAEFEAIQKRATDMREKARQREAAVSIDILKRRIPEWGPEHYAKLKQHAVDELGYTEAEIDDSTDWRLMNAINRSLVTADSAKNIKTVKRTSVKAPRGTHNKPQGATRRNAQGQFQSARDVLRNNPGSKQAGRDYFLNKLKAERGGR